MGKVIQFKTKNSQSQQITQDQPLMSTMDFLLMLMQDLAEDKMQCAKAIREIHELATLTATIREPKLHIQLAKMGVFILDDTTNV